MEAIWWLTLASFLVSTLGKDFDEQQLELLRNGRSSDEYFLKDIKNANEEILEGRLHPKTLKENEKPANEKLQLEQVTGQGIPSDVRELIFPTWQKVLSGLTPKNEPFDVSRTLSAEGFMKEQTTRVRIEAWYCLSKEASCMSKPVDKAAIKEQLEALWNSVSKETADAWNRITVYAKRDHVAFLVQVSDNVTQAGKKTSSSSDIEFIEFPVSLLNPKDPFVYPQNVTEKISSFLFGVPGNPSISGVLQNAKISFGKGINHGPSFVHAEETFVSTYRIRITLHTYTIPSSSSFNKTVEDVQNHIKNEQFCSPPYLIIKKELMRVHIETL